MLAFVTIEATLSANHKTIFFPLKLLGNLKKFLLLLTNKVKYSALLTKVTLNKPCLFCEVFLTKLKFLFF